jgi:hypothetical protein
MKPSTPLLLDLLDLFERSGHPQVTREAVSLPGVPGWALSEYSSLDQHAVMEWFDQIGDAGSFQVSTDEGPVTVPLEDDEQGACMYRCPVTFKAHRLPADKGVLYSIRPQRLLNQLADLLSIPQAHRNGIVRPAIDGVLWRLGQTRIGVIHTDIWIARNLHENLDDVFRYLEDPRQPDQGVILTTSADLPTRQTTPRRFCFVSISRVISGTGSPTSIDTDLVHRIMTSPSGTDLRPSLPVEYDEFNGILKISGKAPWEIHGAAQRGVVHYMYGQYLNNRTTLQSAEILKSVGRGGDQYGGARRIQDIFSGNPKWKQYIHTVERGKYAFKTD